MAKPSYLNFDNKNYKWNNDIDYRKCPEAYRVGQGEQRVLICQPYTMQFCLIGSLTLLKLLKKVVKKIYEIFLKFLENNDFVGADIVRKYLQMGFTRSTHYTADIFSKNGKKQQK
ncbi:hypothetical protein A1E_03750 [Rickettsia canadensis str. McKiel]|uniref:Uncharacterized protein n=1 Tax=Rickettsia canadensis (strain McKiel) TaxID=293613 RepID=A8EZ96_RICCK|nr:DUF4385 family protein [Rickettsia canadensis]ABV73679.1 hypothetical protein A1E_03750 [Rickettsia canadensis str. McKiel]